MKIKFKNGRYIKSISDSKNNIRNERWNKQIAYWNKHPDKFMELIRFELLPYQRIILKSLLKIEEKEMYGYQIIKELEQRSETVFSLKEGTLYPILHVLEQDGFLEAYWEDTSSARKRRFYRITKKGRKELDRQKEEWKEYAGAVGKVLQLQNA